MTTARMMHVEVGSTEDAWTTFARDQLLLLRCAAEGQAWARVWRRAEPGLLLGRFHRAPLAATNSEKGRDGLSRRLSGGRVVPVGPGVVCMTMVAPLVNWFDPASSALRPEQVLNRALRPVLAMLRDDGVDAFYPGRDLITVGGRAIAHASFTVMRDGVAVVDVQVAESTAWTNLPGLLDQFDPQGVAGVDRGGFAQASSLVEAATAARVDAEWVARLARFGATTFGCETDVSQADDPQESDVDQGVTSASRRAAHEFLVEPGPLPEGQRTAAAVSMLGMVECTGRMHGDRLRDLRITGDLLAPFHTLDDIAAACEGQPFRAANIRKALARVMASPRNFVLGVAKLDELILRLG